MQTRSFTVIETVERFFSGELRGQIGPFLDDGYTVHQPTITMKTTRKTPPNQQDETETNTQANQRNKDNEQTFPKAKDKANV